MMLCIRDSRQSSGYFVSHFVIAALPEFAFAHATPIQYVPAASSVLSQAPAEVQIHFSERVEPRVSSITVLAPDGSRADLSNSAADPADPRVYRVGLKDGGAGTYTVSWQVISADDGHFAKGAYVFSVGNARPERRPRIPADSRRFTAQAFLKP